MTRTKIDLVSNTGLVLLMFIVSLGPVSFTYAQKKTSTPKKRVQTPKVVKTPDYENRLMAVGLGLILNLPELVASDEKVFFDPETTGDIVKALPLLANELEPLNSLQGQSEEVRAQTVALVERQVEAKLTGSHAWQFAVGKSSAAVMGELIKSIKDPNYQIDKTGLRAKLVKLQRSLKAPPADFPPPVLRKLKELSNMAARKNLTSLDNLRTMLSKFFEVFDIISPAKK